MPQQHLNNLQVGAMVQQVSSKTVAKHMRCDATQTSAPAQNVEQALDGRAVQRPGRSAVESSKRLG